MYAMPPVGMNLRRRKQKWVVRIGSMVGSGAEEHSVGLSLVEKSESTFSSATRGAMSLQGEKKMLRGDASCL